MNLVICLSAEVLLLPVIYIWRRGVGIALAVLAFALPLAIYCGFSIPVRTFLWSWAMPLALGLCLWLPSAQWLYQQLARRINHWSKFTLEIADTEGHLHYVKRINEGTYINGGSGSGKTASCNKAYARHAAHFKMSLLVHDLKKYELSEALYSIFEQVNMPFHVFALFDPERSIRVNPIAAEYLPDEASLRSRVKSFITAVQGRISEDSTSDFFNNSASSLLEALIWYLKLNNPEYCNLPFIMALINSPENLHRHEGKKVIPYGALKQLLMRDPQVYSMAAAFFQGTGNVDTTSNILQTLILALNTINTDAGFFLLSENDIDLRINKPQHSEVLALVNDPKNTTAYAPILAMAADATLTMMSERGGDPAVVLLDEAPELPILRIQNYMATLRSLGICIVYTTQDLSQIQRSQGGKEYNLRTVLSNLAHQFLGRTSLEQTAKYYEGMMPQIEKNEKTYSSSANGTSVSRRKVRKPLYEKSEFYTLQQGEFVYFHGRVERFRFRFIQEPKKLPPKIRKISAAEMHEHASRIRQQAADFMQEFQY